MRAVGNTHIYNDAATDAALLRAHGDLTAAARPSISSAAARAKIVAAKRIVVKVGTSVVSSKSGHLALGRMGAIIEQICRLVRSGKQIILVSSGAVGIGRRRLNRRFMLTRSLGSLVNSSVAVDETVAAGAGAGSDGGGTQRHACAATAMRSCAAAGQSGLMALYDTFFSEYGIGVSQILVTDADFSNDASREAFRGTVNHLLGLGIVPILNENDAISTRHTPLRDENNRIFWDNDSLAALVACETSADSLLLLTDVAGLYRNPPSEDEEPEIVPTYTPGSFTIGAKSRVGRGGMQAKIEAALSAIDRGVPSVVIASGYAGDTLPNVLVHGKPVGTLFVDNPQPEPELTTKAAARAARAASRQLQAVGRGGRCRILHAMADALLEGRDAILAANRVDIELAAATDMAPALRARLVLSEAKLQRLADGIRALANAGDKTLGKVLRRTQVAPGLELKQVTVPIGVLLVIFESRPDVLPQVAALAVRSGNGVLLKGGSEALRSVQALHAVITRAIVEASGGGVDGGVVGLVTSRQEVGTLLELDEFIDLVIPRGSGEMVKYIQDNTRIPVLGHAEGVCHVFVDADTDVDAAFRLVLDAKTNYPAACNAMETLLLHVDTVTRGDAAVLLRRLQDQGVVVHGGPRAVAELGLPPLTSPGFSTEYGALACSVAVVDDVAAAIDHIHRYGSGHTEAIVTRNAATARAFADAVDAACVFVNASTRFADGYRFGLGAEVGISTGRIHARGPVGVEGLTTTKWVLVASPGEQEVATVTEFANGNRKYTHEPLPLERAGDGDGDGEGEGEGEGGCGGGCGGGGSLGTATCSADGCAAGGSCSGGADGVGAGAGAGVDVGVDVGVVAGAGVGSDGAGSTVAVKMSGEHHGVVSKL